mmetsp:Transcript_25639/g.46308  ORF Transcript_25639/g.46308 Transcript_25639/m.46308 type:complete len:85 (+) Transcript_25639:953-1207(+)
MPSAPSWRERERANMSEGVSESVPSSAFVAEASLFLALAAAHKLNRVKDRIVVRKRCQMLGFQGCVCVCVLGNGFEWMWFLLPT